MPEFSRARLSWLLPPLLATLAIAFQFAFDVPKAAMLPRPTPEEKAAEAKAKKAKKAKARKRKAIEDKRKRKAARKHAWKPRGDKEVARLRRTYSTTPLEDEPRDVSFRRHHEAILRGAATKLRAAAVGAGKTASMQIRPACRTLRCELELCGEAELLEQVAALLPNLRVNDDEPLWHEMRELEPRPAKLEKGPRDRSCRRWLVDFAHEDLTMRKISLLESPDAEK